MLEEEYEYEKEWINELEIFTFEVSDSEIIEI
jgi:hypothetical protein